MDGREVVIACRGSSPVHKEGFVNPMERAAPPQVGVEEDEVLALRTTRAVRWRRRGVRVEKEDREDVGGLPAGAQGGLVRASKGQF